MRFALVKIMNSLRLTIMEDHALSLHYGTDLSSELEKLD